MQERPILFSAPMVKALLAGTKTQTRRAFRPQPHPLTGDEVCPYGVAGERLWVRESWRALACHDDHAPRDIGRGNVIHYEADWKAQMAAGPNGWGKLRPSMFMPRWASRITLELTGVRVKRLKDISRGDAMDEGCPFPNMAKGDDPRQWYAVLWESINGVGSWDRNPWVWVVEFRRG